MNKSREQQLKDHASHSVLADVNGSVFRVGDTVKAFNGTEWQKTGDVGDNSQFYNEAEIIALRWHNSMFGGTDYVADIKWKHNGEISNGHFVRGLKHCR